MSFRIVSVSNFDELMSAVEQRDGDEQLLIINTTAMTAEQFVQAVASAKMAAFDFDGTLTTGSQFGIMRELLMRPDLAAQDVEDARAYFSGADQSNFGHISFIFRTVKRLADSIVSYSAFEAAVKNAKPRDGACTLLQTFSTHDVESSVAIISYGLNDWIFAWLKHFIDYQLYRQFGIYALHLQWGRHCPRYLMSSIGYRTVVTDSNKGYVMAMHCAQYGNGIVRPHQVFCMGDSAQTDLALLTEAVVRSPDGKIVQAGPSVLIIPKEKAISRAEAAMREQHRTVLPLKRAFEAGVAAFYFGDSLDPFVQIRTGKIAV